RFSESERQTSSHAVAPQRNLLTQGLFQVSPQSSAKDFSLPLCVLAQPCSYVLSTVSTEQTPINSWSSRYLPAPQGLILPPKLKCCQKERNISTEGHTQLV
ncbi:unnamed protein product, partial [Ectocarpus sp. 12 AP-2014]